MVWQLMVLFEAPRPTFDGNKFAGIALIVHYEANRICLWRHRSGYFDPRCAVLVF
jgi:hypothetical protein